MRLALLLSLVVAGFVVFASVAPAQQAPRPDAISQLLDEVHLLRVALERQSSTGARVQLLSSRVALQDERVYRASQQLDALHRELLDVDRMEQEARSRAKGIEEAIETISDPERRQDLEGAQRQFKLELASHSNRQQALRAREQELLAALGFEQAKLDEINRRLDDLERLLEPR